MTAAASKSRAKRASRPVYAICLRLVDAATGEELARSSRATTSTASWQRTAATASAMSTGWRSRPRVVPRSNGWPLSSGACWSATLRRSATWTRTPRWDVIQSSATRAGGNARWRLDKKGTLTMTGLNDGGHLTIKGRAIRVYDANGTLRVRLAIFLRWYRACKDRAPTAFSCWVSQSG